MVTNSPPATVSSGMLSHFKRVTTTNYRAFMIQILLDKEGMGVGELRSLETAIHPSVNLKAVVALLQTWNEDLLFYPITGVQSSPNRLTLYYTKNSNQFLK